jgi:hypothetical protein
MTKVEVELLKRVNELKLENQRLEKKLKDIKDFVIARKNNPENTHEEQIVLNVLFIQIEWD